MEKTQNQTAHSSRKVSLNPEYTKPSPETKLWRYMDLTKFLSMIQTSSLYFARPDTFDDPFECAIGSKSMEERYNLGMVYPILCSSAKRKGIDLPENIIEWAKERFSRQIVQKVNEEYNKLEECKKQEVNLSEFVNNILEKETQNFLEQLFPELLEEIKEKGVDNEILENVKKIGKTVKDQLGVKIGDVFISCWYASDYESEAMWELYSTNCQGIAIQTTYQQLEDSFVGNPNIIIGEVQYIDFSKRYADLRCPYWFKRKAFEHEKEVRAVYESHEDNDRKGINIKVDLDKLIENIYVSPLAEDYYVAVVNDITKKYEIHKNIKYSSLKDEPFFGR